jgi:hypothetical protein
MREISPLYKPLNSRIQILSTLRENLNLEIVQLEKEISELRSFKGLSQATLQERISDLREHSNELKKLLDRAGVLQQTTDPAHLFIYQYGYGKPSDSAPYFLGTDTNLWKGTKWVTFMPEFSGKKAGSKWTHFNDRAEQDEFFHIFFRI